MTKEEYGQVVQDLKEKGFDSAEYTQNNGGQFSLRKERGRELYIREANPVIGFYGVAYATMRQWAVIQIGAFANQQLKGWERFLLDTENPDGGRAVWFNLRPTTDQRGNWFERRKDVIEAAWKLYRKLEDDGIFDEKFDPSKYIVNNAGNQAEGPVKNESTIESTIKSLLDANLNVILTGAPGTGKTYTAKEVAKAMVGAKVSEDATDDEKKRAKEAEEERIASVQFHPGYDYSDFVVGMKPKIVDGKDGDKAVSFDWEDGVFKKFADKAKADLEHNYVFLIDEINRADLSRVFGELFSLLEEDYRYYKNEDGTEVNAKGITLPNGKNFVIPRNLYILGTMNDIDRSVESMDFALRRRFAWKEVKATDTQNDILDALDKKGNRKIAEPEANKLKDAMQKLNDVIGGAAKLKLKDGTETDLRLGTAYQLGGAIFAKFEKCDGVFDALWDNHISNVLGEYLRGHRYRDDILIALRGIFDDAIKEGNGEKSSEKTSEAPTAPTGQQAAPQA